MWVKIRGLPNHWSSKEVGWRLGKCFNYCLNVIMLENGSKDGKILKLLAEVSLAKPLMRESNIKLANEIHWVEFKYNQLPIFCFYCGVVGHPERACELKMFDTKERHVSEDQYGDWIRAAMPIAGRKREIGESSQKLQLKERGKPPREEPERKQIQKK